MRCRLVSADTNKSLQHDTDATPLRPFEELLVNSVKLATEIVLLDVPDDLRQLAISVAHSFLVARPAVCARSLRYPFCPPVQYSRLICFSLSRLTMTIGNAMSKWGPTDSSVQAQGKAFLSAAFIQ